MTQTRFTPGPWYATSNGGDDPDERKLLVGKADEYGDFTMIADAKSKWLEDEVGGTEEANAHLIAAAPELYEAAIALIAWDDSEEAGPDYGTLTRDTHPNGEVIWREWYDRNMDNCDRAFRLARSATAKARGES